jgi:hypothetical protein
MGQVLSERSESKGAALGQVRPHCL